MGIEDSSDAVPVVLPESIAELVRPVLKDIGALDGVLDAEIVRCYGVEDSSSLVRNGVRSGTRIIVERPVSDVGEKRTSFRYAFSIRGDDRELTAHIPGSTPLRFQANQQWHEWAIEELSWVLSSHRDDDDDERSYTVRDFILRLAESIGTDIISPLSRPAYYLPADRTGVIHAHRVVVGSIIGQASRAGLRRDTPLPQLSGVLADFLGRAYQLGRSTRDEATYVS